MKLRRKKKTEMPLDDMMLDLKTGQGDLLARFPTELIENVRRLVTKVHYKDALPQKLAITSAIRQEGVTYVSWALGTAIASDLQRSVCVVELNWWFPADHFQNGEVEGLTAVLQEKQTLEQAIVPTSIKNLDLLPAGNLPRLQRPNTARSQRLHEIIQQLSTQYDHVLLDIPAIRTTSDAIPLASLGDACTLVVHQGITNIGDVRMALDDIAHVPMLGVIMNHVQLKTPSFIMKFIPQV